MTVSLRDVAARARVSAKTVSNVVNGRDDEVGPGTRARVQAVLDELNYRPNHSARSLRSGRSGIIALALPHLDVPYFAELAGNVVRVAEQRGYLVLIDQTEGLPARERVVLDGIRPHLVDGVVFSPLAVDRAAVANRGDDTPIVLLGEAVLDGPADHVGIDNVAVGRLATEHLLSSGRRRIAALGVQPGASNGTADLRERGYREALLAAGVALDETLLVGAEEYNRRAGAAAMGRLLASGAEPDAVFCFNDLLAHGALRTLLTSGRSVPGDVAVVGVDDIEEDRYSTPSLSSVAPDKLTLAQLAVEAVIDRIDGGTGVARDLLAPVEVVIRESSAPVTDQATGKVPDRATAVSARRTRRPRTASAR